MFCDPFQVMCLLNGSSLCSYFQSGGFWSTLTNSASSGWNSLQNLANIWSPSSPPQPPPMTQSPPTPPASPPSPTATTVAQNSTLRPEAPPFTASDSQPGFLSTAAVSAAAAASQQSQVISWLWF